MILANEVSRLNALKIWYRWPNLKLLFFRNENTVICPHCFFPLSQAGKRSLGRALGWMDQYLEDAIDKVNKAISLIWQQFPFFKRLSEVENHNEI